MIGLVRVLALVALLLLTRLVLPWVVGVMRSHIYDAADLEGDCGDLGMLQIRTSRRSGCKNWVSLRLRGVDEW